MSIKFEGIKYSDFVSGMSEASSPASDDYLALDGDSNGTRRMLASKLATAEALSAEAAARLKDEESLGQSISSVGNSLSEKVAAEETARSEADTQLDEAIDKIKVSLPATTTVTITDGVNLTGLNTTKDITYDIAIKKGCFYTFEKYNSSGNYDYGFCHSVDADGNTVQEFYRGKNSAGSISAGFPTEPIEATASAEKLVIRGYESAGVNIHHDEIQVDNVYNKLPNRWCGKKWLLIGDSISTERGSYATIGYGWRVAKSLGMGYCNVARSGVVMSYFMDKIDGYSDDFDLISVMLGTNNHGYSCAIGSLNDSYYKAGTYNQNSSFYAQTQLLYEKLRTKYPKSVICFITPIKRTSTSSDVANNDDGYQINAYNLTTEPYADAVKDVCRWYSIPCIDIFNSIDPRTETARTNFFVSSSDGTHPNDLGHAMFIAPLIENEFVKIAPYVFNDWDA